MGGVFVAIQSLGPALVPLFPHFVRWVLRRTHDVAGVQLETLKTAVKVDSFIDRLHCRQFLSLNLIPLWKFEAFPNAYPEYESQWKLRIVVVVWRVIGLSTMGPRSPSTEHREP